MSLLSIILLSILIMLFLPKTGAFIMDGYRSVFRFIWEFLPKLFRFLITVFQHLLEEILKLLKFLWKELVDLYEKFSSRT